MSAPRRHWPSLVAVLRGPLIHQPFTILAYVLTALAWTLVATALCVGRLAAVVAGESAFIGGIVLCILGFGHIGAPLGVAGFVASRLAA